MPEAISLSKWITITLFFKSTHRMDFVITNLHYLPNTSAWPIFLRVWILSSSMSQLYEISHGAISMNETEASWDRGTDMRSVTWDSGTALCEIYSHLPDLLKLYSKRITPISQYLTPVSYNGITSVPMSWWAAPGQSCVPSSEVLSLN